MTRMQNVLTSRPRKVGRNWFPLSRSIYRVACIGNQERLGKASRSEKCLRFALGTAAFLAAQHNFDIRQG